MEVAVLLGMLPGEGSVPVLQIGTKLAAGLDQPDSGSKKLIGNHSESCSMALPSAEMSSLKLSSICCWVGLGVFLQLASNSPSKRIILSDFNWFLRGMGHCFSMKKNYLE